MAKNIIVTADKVRNRNKLTKIVRRALFILLIFLVLLYIILDIIYSEGSFTVVLDSNQALDSGLAIFDDLKSGRGKRKLEATPIKFMDNISYKWLPDNVDTEADGSHNGQNYIAYSFFVENQGDEVINYHYEVIVDDIIKNVDEAIRIRIYRNGESVTYAKKNSINNKPEINTTPFKEVKDSEETIILEKVTDFKPDDLDRYTIIVWLEGDDPDCVDSLIGGEIKMHMVITEEHIEQG